MNEFDLVVIDDAVARRWLPFTLTRPAAELLFGTMTLRARIERAWGVKARAILSENALAGFEEEDTPPVVSHMARLERPTLFVSSRFVPDGPLPAPEIGRVYAVADQAVAWAVPANGTIPIFEAAAAEPAQLPGSVLRHVWELMSRNGKQTASDIEIALRNGGSPLPPGTFALGEPQLRIGANVVIEPGVVFDFTAGPIALDDDVRIRAFARVAGPSWFGRGTVAFGGSYTAVTAGPQCRLRGELEETVILGYSNKAHDGFIGHAYLGRWVNLGAMTTNSDLKNNYGPVRLWTADDPEAHTGEMKIGSFLGDHVKTGIGVLLNTGTVVGAGANLFGGLQPAKYVPPFSWGSGRDLATYDLHKFLETAQTVMRRRSIELSDGMRGVLERAWHGSRNERNA